MRKRVNGAHNIKLVKGEWPGGAPKTCYRLDSGQYQNGHNPNRINLRGCTHEGNSYMQHIMSMTWLHDEHRFICQWERPDGVLDTFPVDPVDYASLVVEKFEKLPNDDADGCASAEESE